MTTTRALAMRPEIIDADAGRAGVVEIGSRTVRLLVGTLAPDGSIVRLAGDSRQVWFAKALSSASEAPSTKTEEVLTAVQEFRARCKELGAGRICVFGTEALRRLSAEHPRLYQGLKAQLPELKVLLGREESRLSLVAALKSLPGLVPDDGMALVLDQGGGSLELAVGSVSLGLRAHKSYKLGADALRRLLWEKDGRISRFTESLARHIRDYSLAQLRHEAAEAQRTIVLGSAATKLGWVSLRPSPQHIYDPRRVHGHVFSSSFIEEAFLPYVRSVCGGDSVPRSAPKVWAEFDPRDATGDDFETVLTGALALRLFLNALRKKEFVVGAFGGLSLGVLWSLLTERFGPFVRAG